jgi:hypothetical protein
MMKLVNSREIITKEEQQEFLNWIFSNEDKFLPNYAGPYRKFITLDKINESEKPKLFFEVKNRILKKENILEWEQDPLFGDIVTWNTTKGFIHEHLDESLPGREHFRFNLFLSKPEKGGDPILMGEKLNFEERQYIKYHVNKQKHKSLPVEGDKPRIAISYGISITTEYLNNLTSLMGA